MLMKKNRNISARYAQISGDELRDRSAAIVWTS
jgi:hypothetical protein